MALLSLAGCASPLPPQSPADRRREEAARAHERASTSIARGEYDAALRQYQSNLERSAAVEDQYESAISMLNMAAVQHRSGNYAAARAMVLAVIGHEPSFPAAYVGRAEARLALIELQQNRLDEAALHAERAERLCAASDCVWRLALQNILAEIEMHRGDLVAAEARLRSTLASAGRSADKREQANAWRLLGLVEAKRGRATEARQALLVALEIDGKLEVPERIALDLISLARLERDSGNAQAASRYARRAAAVAEAARLPTVLAEARSLLDSGK